MGLQDWADVGQIVSGLATVIVLVQLVHQLRQDKQNRIEAARAMEQTSLKHANDMYARDKALLDAQIVHDREMAAQMEGLVASQKAHADEMAALKRQMSYETYMRANERYLHYLEICLQNPSLNIFDYADHLPLRDEPEHPRQSLIAFAILMGTLEHGFVCSYDQDDDLGQKQHNDWLWYMQDWAKKPEFQIKWKLMSEGYDARFVECMDRFIESAHSDRSDSVPLEMGKG